jgi:hypothetical protein
MERKAVSSPDLYSPIEHAQGRREPGPGGNMILAVACNPENANEIPNPQFILRFAQALQNPFGHNYPLSRQGSPNKSQIPKLQFSNRALDARFSDSAIHISGYRWL